MISYMLPLAGLLLLVAALFLAYRKGKSDEKNRILKKSVEQFEAEREIHSRPAGSDSDIVDGL